MKCDICKIREATVHLTEIINNKVTKLHLCEQCARQKSQEMEEHFGLADLLAGLSDIIPAVDKNQRVAEATAKCPSCEFTFQHFRKMGRLGCPNCYEAFKDQLNPLLKKIHGSDTHIGKAPLKKAPARSEAVLLRDLRMKLEKAVKTEEFEEAARLRDRIRALEKKEKKK